MIGKSGSGKSTFLKSLIKIFEDKKKTVAYLPQQPHFFKTSIKENITLFKEVDDEKILKVMKQVNLKFELDEMIENISRGQLQRLAFARCLLIGTPIFILDEPTSALDVDTKQIIIKIIFNLRQNLIIATHDSDIIGFSDEIINLDIIESD